MRRKADWKEKAIMKQFTDEYDRFYRLAFSYLHQPEDAMDVVQESVCKALSSKESLKAPEYVKTWCYRIVMNTSLDLLRKRKKETVGIDMYEKEENGSLDGNFENIEVMELLSTLKEKDRAVVILRYFEDMKLEEIAIVLNENVSTVKSRLYRTLKQLKIQCKKGMDEYDERKTGTNE